MIWGENPLFFGHPQILPNCLPPTKKRKLLEAHPSQASNRVVPPCGSSTFFDLKKFRLLDIKMGPMNSRKGMTKFSKMKQSFFAILGKKSIPFQVARDLLVFVSVEKIFEEIQTTWLREMSQFSYCRGSVLESKNLSLFLQACFPSFSDLKTSSSSPTRPNI